MILDGSFVVWRRREGDGRSLLVVFFGFLVLRLSLVCGSEGVVFGEVGCRVRLGRVGGGEDLEGLGFEGSFRYFYLIYIIVISVVIFYFFVFIRIVIDVGNVYSMGRRLSLFRYLIVWYLDF